MAKRKYSGIAQIFGLLGCGFFLFFSFSWLFNDDRHLAWEMRLVFLFLCLFLDALALRSLFEGDDSLLGKFFFRIGDFAMGLFKVVAEPLAIKSFGEKFKDLPKGVVDDEGEESRKRDLNQL